MKNDFNMIHLVEMHVSHENKCYFKLKCHSVNTEKGEGILDKFLEQKETNAHLTNRLTLDHSHLSFA